MNTKLIIILVLLASCLVVLAIVRAKYTAGKAAENGVQIASQGIIKDGVYAKRFTDLSSLVLPER